MEHHVHCYLKSSKIHHTRNIIQLLKARNSEAQARGTKGENNYFSMLLWCSGCGYAWQLVVGAALTQECRQSPAYSPVYLNSCIISLSRKKQKSV